MVWTRAPGLLVARLSSTRSVGSTGLLYRLSSSSSKSGFNNSPIQATVSDDGKTIVCWHPEQLSHVKYEHTKPLPVQKEVDSVIKAEVHSEVDKIIYNRDLNDEDLIRLAYRPRSLWRIPTRERKRHLYKPDPPLDRIGI